MILSPIQIIILLIMINVIIILLLLLLIIMIKWINNIVFQFNLLFYKKAIIISRWEIFTRFINP